MSGVTMNTYSVNPMDYLSSTRGVTGSVSLSGAAGGSSGSSGTGSLDTQQLIMEILQEILQILSQSQQGSDDGTGSPSGGSSTPPISDGDGGCNGGYGGSGSVGGSGGTRSVGGGSGSGSRGVQFTNGAGAPVSGPSKVDLSGFGDLQLPSGSAGHVDTVGAGQLDNYNSQYFRHNSNGSVTLTVPEGGGVHTAHSNFPRTELEEKGSWKMSSGTSTLSSTLSVDKLPKSGDVVIGQIHQKVSSGKPRPPVELHYDKGNLVASVMDSNSLSAGRHNVTIATGIQPGQKFSYSMQMQPNGQLNISAAGQSKSIRMDSSFDSSNMYFKMGNYCQDPSGGSAVTFYGDNISHTS